MRLVDTSAWIEWLTGSETSRDLATLIPTRDEWLVPTIVQLELAKWMAREIDEDKADQIFAFTQTCRVTPLDTRIALAAAEICGRLKLATADAIVYATALIHEADLLTCDSHFDGLPGVTFVAKHRA